MVDDKRKVYTMQNLHEWAELDPREIKAARTDLAAAVKAYANYADALARIKQLEAELAAMRAETADPFMPSDEEWRKYPSAMWSAVDGNGIPYFYRDEPEMSGVFPRWLGGVLCIVRLVPNWRESKRRRPEGI